MDGEVHGFDRELNLGDIIGEDKRRYGFALADWHAAGTPERGAKVRFAVDAGRATQIHVTRPAHPPPPALFETIAAIYVTAYGPGSPDFFGAVSIRKRDFVLPTIAILMLGLLQAQLRGSIPDALYRMPLWIALLVVAVVMIVLFVMLVIATGVVALLGCAMGEGGRVRAGILAFLWVEAAVVQPIICILRLSLSPRDPGVVLSLLGAGLIAALIGAGRVVKAGFQLSSAALGVLIVIVASGVSFIIDRLIG